MKDLYRIEASSPERVEMINTRKIISDNKNFSKVSILCILSILCTVLQAVPIKNYPKILTQPDGTQVKVLLSGDEYYNWVTDTLGYTLLKNQQGWIVYADLMNDELISTEYNVYHY
jgi:hypothetical protein